MTESTRALDESVAFDAHIRETAWFKVLDSAKDEDRDGASMFRIAKMAASEAWQARGSLSHTAAQGSDTVPATTVTRVEVIGRERLYVGHNLENVMLSYQDEGRTLKVFVKAPEDAAMTTVKP